MIDSAQATEYLTSMLKGFKLEASEATDAVSMLTALDMDFAASAGDIAEALSRMATSAQLAGMSIQEAAAAVTVIKDVSQKSASSIGESIKTLLSRFGNVKAGAFVDVETGEADKTLNDTEKVLNAIGISIRSSSMEFRSFSDVLDDVANKWVSLTTVEQNAVATAMAGTRQRENFNILMENYNSYKEAIETASDSQGTAEEKYEAYMDSIEAHLNQLKDAWDELAQNFEGSTFFKGVVDFATFLVEQLPKIIKLFSTLFMTLNAYKMPMWLNNLWGVFDPRKAVSTGRFKGARSRFTTGGMEDRANILKYEKLKEAGKDTSEIEAKLPKEYRDTFITGDGNLNDTAKPIVDEQRKTNSTLDSIESMVQTITSSSSSTTGPMISIKDTGPTGIDPEPIAKLRNEVGDDIHQKGTLKYDEWRAKQRVGNLQSAYNARNLDEKISEKAASLGSDSTEEDLKEYNDLIAERARRLQEIDSASQDRLAITNKIAQKEAEINRLLKEQEAARQTSASEVVSESQAEMTITAEKRTQLQQEQLATQEDIKQRIEEEKSLNAEKGQLAAEQAQTVQDQVQAATEASSTGFSQMTTVPGQSLLPGTATSGITSGVPKKAGIGSKITSKLGGLSGGAGFSALSGLMGALTAGVTAFATQEGDTTDKFVAAASNGVATGLISVIPGIGPILGGILGPILGDWISGAILDAIHAEEDARAERVEKAQEQLEVLEKINSNLENIETSLKERADWDSSDYKEMSDYISETLDLLRTNKDLREAFQENAAKMSSEFVDKSATELMEYLRSGTDAQAQMILAALNRAQGAATVETTFASQEQERYDIAERLEEAEKIGTISDNPNQATALNALDGLEGVERKYDSWEQTYKYYITGNSPEEQLENLQRARVEIEAKANEAAEGNNKGLQQEYEELLETIDNQIEAVEKGIGEIANLDDDLNEDAVSQAFNESLSMWDGVKIANSTLEEAVYVMAQNLQLYGEAVYDASGQITEEARNRIEAFLREDEAFSSLFGEDDTPLRRLLAQEGERNALLEGTGFSYDELREAVDYNDSEQQQKILDAINKLRAPDAQLSLDTLVSLTYKLDPDNLEAFAEALGMTTEEAGELKNKLGNASLGDLLGDPNDTIDEISNKISILSDIMKNGTISAENYMKVLSSYPELLQEYNEAGEVVGLGTDNIIKNLMADVYGSEGNLGTLLGFQQYEDLKTNTNLYSSFKELAKNKYTGSMDLGFLETATTFNDDIIAKLNSDEELWSLYMEMMEGMTVDTSMYYELIQGLIDYQSTVIDQEIDALQSQKDALDDVNDARQKELDLIKAKDALENAKNEKKMVYRAGVGWTYESNQTAVQEAKQNLEDLETDKEQEDLQYQIDQLESEKAFLEAIPTSEELNAQKEVYEQWMNTITENGEKQADILTELQNAYTQIGEIAGAIGEWADKDSSTKSEAEQAAEALIKNTGEGTEAAVNTAMENLQSSGLSEGDEGYESYVQKIQDQVSAWEGNVQKSGIGNYMDKSFSEAQAAGFTGAKTEDEFEALKDQYTALNDFKSENKDLLNYDISRQVQDFGGGLRLKVAPDEYWAMNGAALVEPIKDNAASFNNYHKGGERDRVYRWNPESGAWDMLDDDSGGGQSWTLDADAVDGYPTGAVLKATGHNGVRYAIKNDNGVWLKGYEANREGTYDFGGGATLINEEGTEGIITPQGVLTALPSKSGIVPADLTKNLFVLGEVAPNLVKTLDSLTTPFEGAGVSNVDDHSTNVQNLYATFQAEEGFDFDSLLSDIRGVINTSRHNS